MTAAELRKNIYKVIEEVSQTGVPVRVTLRGISVLIVPEKAGSKLARLKKRAIINGDREDIIHNDWVKEWKPFI